MNTTGKLVGLPNIMSRIKRGLAGYVSYLAACEMNQAFSEYVLYEPILRILLARNYKVECEAVCPGVKQPKSGDKKRLDFVARGHGSHFALEVKWAKRRKLHVENDFEKLEGFRKAQPGNRSFLCAFGRKSVLRHIELVGGRFKERGKAVIAEFKITKYGCRIYEVQA